MLYYIITIKSFEKILTKFQKTVDKLNNELYNRSIKRK